jgi:hypothetical protein
MEQNKRPDDLVDIGPGGFISIQGQKTEEKPVQQVAPSDMVSVDPDYVESQVDLLNPVTKAAAVGAAARPLVKKVLGMDEQTGRQSLETYLKSQIHHKYPGLNLDALEKEVQKIYGPQARVSTMAEVQAALNAVQGPVFGKPTVDLSPYSKNILTGKTRAGQGEMLLKSVGENINPITGQGFGAKTMRTAGRGVIGGAAGVQGASAYNRAQEGDISGAATSGMGALGAALMTSRNPKFKGAGAILQGLSLPGQFMREEKEGYKHGGLVHLAEGGGKLGVANSVVKKLSDVLIPREGQTIAGTMADRTKATGGFSGGPGFINMHPEYTWAMDSPGAANRLLNVVKNAGGADRVAVAPMLMSTSAHRSNRPVFEKMYLELMEDVKSGKVTPEQIAALNKRLSVEKTLPGAPDITSKDFLDYANAFKRRGTIADIMGQKRIGALDLQRHLDETIDPALREAELGAIGPQLFSAESQILKPGVHPGYKNLILGQKGEDQFTPVPREFLFRDLEAKAMKELGRPLSDYNYRQSVGIPTQVIDEKLLRSLQTLGYKKGGSTTPAWQRSEGKSPSGGLNALGRASYKRETGGELKAPQPEGGSRKKSFCARMGGMKKKLTSSKTANDPDSRINKALRKWKC